MIGLCTCCILLLAILGKYIHAHRQLFIWRSSFEDSESTAHNGITSGVDKSSGRPRTKQVYDRWLLVRFSVTFVALL